MVMADDPAKVEPVPISAFPKLWTIKFFPVLAFAVALLRVNAWFELLMVVSPAVGAAALTSLLLALTSETAWLSASPERMVASPKNPPLLMTLFSPVFALAVASLKVVAIFLLVMVNPVLCGCGHEKARVAEAEKTNASARTGMMVNIFFMLFHLSF